MDDRKKRPPSKQNKLPNSSTSSSGVQASGGKAPTATGLARDFSKVPAVQLPGVSGLASDKTAVVTNAIARALAPKSGVKSASSSDPLLAFLNRATSFLRKLDAQTDRLKGDDRARFGAQVYGPATSSKESPGTKPAKKFVDLGSGDFQELKEYFELITLALGDKVPASRREAIEELRERFDKWEELKDPQKAAELLSEAIEAVSEAHETLEEEKKKGTMWPWPLSGHKEGEKSKPQGSTGMMSTPSSRAKGEFATPPLPGGKREPTDPWGLLYMKATDGSGYFALSVNGSMIDIETFGNDLYSEVQFGEGQLVSRFPRGYTFRYVGGEQLFKLLPKP